MVVSILVNCVVFVVFCLLLADYNFGITHNYIYSAVLMVVTGLVVCLLLQVLPNQFKKNSKLKTEISNFKFYKPLKIRWYQKLSATNVAFFSWMILVFVFSMIDKYFERNVLIVNDLPVLSSGLAIIGRGGQGAYVIVEDNGRRVKCRGFYYHLVKKGKPLSANLTYSTTFIGFEKTNCKVRLS
ncbi:hypothetical protein AZ468_21880 [Vibrio europaeus]|uniref:Uncharacterized protein n=1 Tax=Vibrio europaeus TaxID=300876 RepID=A0A178J982_9VIBR|nr:hypothetical protein AZ468_21880 [Vibrio europaeus]QJY39265.1 hypothetical protein HOO69_22290 [Vibrio europaeus]